MAENGQSAGLNQVSSTSSSCVSPACRQGAHLSGSTSATVTFLQLAQFHAGIRCPHQSWREMHQSSMMFIQCRYVLVHDSGSKTMVPLSTTRLAGAASGAVLTNH